MHNLITIILISRIKIILNFEISCSVYHCCVNYYFKKKYQNIELHKDKILLYNKILRKYMFGKKKNVPIIKQVFKYFEFFFSIKNNNNISVKPI
jgi:hypothetical protein